MNISTTKKELHQAFSKLSKTTQLKSQNPLVNYTYISSSPAGVLLHSTDLEVGVKTHINASVNLDGECLFPTSEMNDIIGVLDDGRVDIEVSGPHINIKSESGTSFDISTVPFQEYPEVPENKHENLFCVETISLKEIISSLMYAINSEPTKPALNGACFNFLDDFVDFVATDGHRLVKISKQNTTNIRGSYIIPKKFLSILLLTGISSPAMADITHKLTSSVQLQVNAAATQVERIGSSYSVSGNGVDTTDGTTVNTVSAGTITAGVMAPGTIAATQDVPGASFSYSQTYVQGDAVSQSAPSVGAVSNFSDQVSTAAGTAGDLAGTITTAGVMTITAGGAGTVATGQFVNELTVQ